MSHAETMKAALGSEPRCPRPGQRWHRMFWCAYAAMYDALWDNGLTAEVASAVAELLPSGQPVVEVGAGTGLITSHLVARGYAVIASEPEPCMARLFRARLPDVPLSAHGYAEIPVACGPRSIVAVNVLHMVADPRAAVCALRAAAGPGGTTVIAAPHIATTMSAVCRGLIAAGTTRLRVARFVALHAALAPLTRLAGQAFAPLPEAWTDQAEHVREVRGVQVIAQFAGTAMPASRPRTRTSMKEKR